MKKLRVLSGVLVFCLFLSLLPFSAINALADTNDTTVQSETEQETLPDKIDNSKSKWFPQIGYQYGGSCAAWASTYYQFTYSMAKLNDYDAKNNAEYVASPKHVWTYLSNGTTRGVDEDYCIDYLDKYGWVSWQDFPQSDTSIDWYDNNEKTSSELFDSLKISVENEYETFYPRYKGDTPITSPDDEDLFQMKKLLSDGHILYLSMIMDAYEDDILPNGDFAILYNKRPENADSSHALSIVGYDDTIYYDLNDDGEKQAFEYGAFKIANSWGTDAYRHNSGFIWILYDAFNQVSNAERMNHERRLAVSGPRMYSYIQTQKQSVDLAIEVTITQKIRNDFDLYIGASQSLPLEEYPPDESTKETINQRGGAASFDGTGRKVYEEDGKSYQIIGETYQTRRFMIDSSELYQQNKLGNHYWIYVEDNDINNDADTYIENIKFVSGGQVLSEFDPAPMTFNVCDLAEEGATEAGYYRSFYLTSIPVAQVEIESPSRKISVGQSMALTAVTTPAEAVNHSVQWSSLNPDIATVDSQGVVTAHAPGVATIAVTALGGTDVTNTYILKVDDHGDEQNTSTSITLNSVTNGKIDAINDVDYFQFTPNVSGSYVFYSTGNTDVDGVLYNAQGTPIMQSQYMSDENYNFGIVYSLTQGTTYYLKVSGTDQTVEGDYSIHVVNNQFTSTIGSLNQDARKVTFEVAVPTVVNRLKIVYASTTYIFEKKDNSQPIRYTDETADFLVSYQTVDENQNYSQWTIIANLPSTSIGSSSTITISALAGNMVLKSNQRIRNLIAYGSSYKTNLTPNTYLSSLLGSMSTTGYTFTAYNWNDQQITATTTTKIATGQKIVQRNAAGDIVHIYYLVLYGDVAGSGVVGDGLINATDSMKVLQEIEETFLGVISKLAADADHDAVISEEDGELILQHAVGKATINQNVAITQEVDSSCYFVTPVTF